MRIRNTDSQSLRRSRTPQCFIFSTVFSPMEFPAEWCRSLRNGSASPFQRQMFTMLATAVYHVSVSCSLCWNYFLNTTIFPEWYRYLINPVMASETFSAKGCPLLKLAGGVAAVWLAAAALPAAAGWPAASCSWSELARASRLSTMCRRWAARSVSVSFAPH